jgi:hypothetical protein
MREKSTNMTRGQPRHSSVSGASTILNLHGPEKKPYTIQNPTRDPALFAEPNIENITPPVMKQHGM